METDNDENILKQQLFCNGYDNAIRPVKDHNTQTIVNVRMMIKSFEFVSNKSSYFAKIFLNFFDFFKSDVDSHLLINSWIITVKIYEKNVQNSAKLHLKFNKKSKSFRVGKMNI
jgi:hypothetical protein